MWLTLLLPRSHEWFSFLLAIQFLCRWLGEFGMGSADNPELIFLLYSHHLSAWFCADILERNSVFVTLGGLRVKRKTLLWKWKPYSEIYRSARSINQSMHLTWSIRSANRLVYRYAMKKKRNRKNGKKKKPFEGV